LISLFTDKRANEDETDGEKRGYWGDDELGSKLWLLDRSRKTPAILAQAEQYAGEALSWLIQDGLTKEISVTAFYEDDQLILDIDTIGVRINYDRKTYIRRYL
jgi:phage gp46-like protein